MGVMGAHYPVKVEEGDRNSYRPPLRRIMLILVKLLVKISPLNFLVASTREMGWGISVEMNKVVEGLVIGTDDYIDRHQGE